MGPTAGRGTFFSKQGNLAKSGRARSTLGQKFSAFRPELWRDFSEGAVCGLVKKGGAKKLGDETALGKKVFAKKPLWVAL
jgi:hypothetical protein